MKKIFSSIAIIAVILSACQREADKVLDQNASKVSEDLSAKSPEGKRPINPYVLNKGLANGRGSFPGWTQFTTAGHNGNGGQITDVGTSSWGTLWMITTNGNQWAYSQNVNGASFNPTNGIWNLIAVERPDGLVGTFSVGNCETSRIDVDNQGRPWMVACDGTVYKHELGSSRLRVVAVPGIKARDISVGANNVVWVIGGINSVGNSVYYLSNGNWIEVPGVTGDNISVDDAGQVYVCGPSSTAVSRYKPQSGQWEVLNSTQFNRAYDIGAGSQYSVQAIPPAAFATTVNKIRLWDNSSYTWSTPYPVVTGRRMECDINGYAYVVSLSGGLTTI